MKYDYINWGPFVMKTKIADEMVKKLLQEGGLNQEGGTVSFLGEI